MADIELDTSQFLALESKVIAHIDQKRRTTALIAAFSAVIGAALASLTTWQFMNTTLQTTSEANEKLASASAKEQQAEARTELENLKSELLQLRKEKESLLAEAREATVAELKNDAELIGNVMRSLMAEATDMSRAASNDAAAAKQSATEARRASLEMTNEMARLKATVTEASDTTQEIVDQAKVVAEELPQQLLEMRDLLGGDEMVIFMQELKVAYDQTREESGINELIAASAIAGRVEDVENKLNQLGRIDPDEYQRVKVWLYTLYQAAEIYPAILEWKTSIGGSERTVKRELGLP